MGSYDGGMRRVVVPAARMVLMVVLVGACATQTVPLRERLPELGQYRPTQINPLDPDRVFPEDGSCALAAARGVRVREVLDGLGGDGVLQLGDRIVAVDGTRVSTSAMLVRQVAGHAAGDMISLTIDRRGEMLNLSVELSESEAGRPMIGIITDTDYRAYSPRGVPLVDVPTSDLQLVRIGGDVLLLDATNLEWQVVTLSREQWAGLAAVGSDVYTLSNPFEGTTIVNVRSGEAVDVAVSDWLFARVLTSVGDLLLVSAVQGDPAADVITATAVVAVDVSTGEAVWTWEPGRSPTAELLLPDIGHRAKAGDLASVSLASLAADGAGRSRFNVFLDASGTELSGWGSPERPTVLDNVIPGGFFSERELLVSGLTSQGWLVSVYAVDGGAVAPIAAIELEEGQVPPRHLAVGDGRYLLQVVSGRASVVDGTANLRLVHPVTRNCSAVFEADRLAPAG